MKIDGRTRLLGVAGTGIAHTLSPRIQNHALQQLGENAVYLPFEIREEDLPDLVRLLPRLGGIGLNVTTPLKALAGRLVQTGDPEVARTGIANTIVYRGMTPVGFATDGKGFRAWMEAQRIRPGAGGIVLLGFGSVVRSLAHSLATEFPTTLVSRTPAKVRETLDAWYADGWPGLPTRTLSWTDPPPARAVLVVAGLPFDFARTAEVAAWLAGLDPAGTVVDLNYGAGRTPLRDQARDRGLSAHDGLGLLVHQAALSLSLWLGRSVDPAMLAEGLTAGAE